MMHRMLLAPQESIEEHEKDRSENTPRDFIDVYLNELEKQGHQPSSFTRKPTSIPLHPVE